MVGGGGVGGMGLRNPGLESSPEPEGGRLSERGDRKGPLPAHGGHEGACPSDSGWGEIGLRNQSPRPLPPPGAGLKLTSPLWPHNGSGLEL